MSGLWSASPRRRYTATWTGWTRFASTGRGIKLSEQYRSCECRVDKSGRQPERLIGIQNYVAGSCGECFQPLEEWEDGICEGCGLQEKAIECSKLERKAK